jgi:CBS domain containing-hemolysin-like protein
MDISVKERMVPLEEYATVQHGSTLQQAVNALAEAHKKWGKENYPHRAILVLDDMGKVIGKLSQWDVIRALEPKYEELFDFERLSHFGFNPSFIKGMLKEHNLWEHPLNDICKAAGRIQVADIMYTPQRGEYVKESASLAEAIHQLIMGRHQSLLVTDEDGGIVGVLRLSDVFHEVCRRIQGCEPE